MELKIYFVVMGEIMFWVIGWVMLSAFVILIFRIIKIAVKKYPSTVLVVEGLPHPDKSGRLSSRR